MNTQHLRIIALQARSQAEYDRRVMVPKWLTELEAVALEAAKRGEHEVRVPSHCHLNAPEIQQHFTGSKVYAVQKPYYLVLNWSDRERLW